MDSRTVLAKVVNDTGDGGYDDSERAAFEESEAQAFLAVPFLRLSGPSGQRRLVVGHARVIATLTGDVQVTVVVQSARAEETGWSAEVGASALTDLETLTGLPLPVEVSPGDGVTDAVRLAKAIAESSRNEVLRLRGLRYEMEGKIAELLARRKRGSLRPLLAQVIELSTALGRARDQAQKANRDGFWIWLWDDETYHANRFGKEPADGPPWARTYRNALRHSEALDEQLAEEISRLQAMLTGISAFAVASDSESQERFNLLAAVAAAGLGLPALILSLYGADSFLPLDSFDHAWRALLPIAIVVLAATTAALRWLPGKSRPRHYAAAVTLALMLILILLFAGALAPPH